jgi:type III secretory pathway component EscV
VPVLPFPIVLVTLLVVLNISEALNLLMAAEALDNPALRD